MRRLDCWRIVSVAATNMPRVVARRESHALDFPGASARPSIDRRLVNSYATFAYTVNGILQSKAITRAVFQSPGTVCQ